MNVREHRQAMDALIALKTAFFAFSETRVEQNDLVDAGCARIAREILCLHELLRQQPEHTLHLVRSGHG